MGANKGLTATAARANGPLHTSLGRRPRTTAHPNRPADNGNGVNGNGVKGNGV